MVESAQRHFRSFHLPIEGTMSAKKTADFLNKLSTSAKTREAFKKDPDAAMRRHKVSPAGRAALKSGNPARIRRHLGDKAPPGCVIVLLI